MPRTDSSSRNEVLAALSMIRYGEVMLFQGAPMLGLAMAGGMRLDNGRTIAAFAVANALLFAHIFALNDWGNLDKDLQDPRRRADTFVQRGVSRGGMLILALVLGVTALGLLASIALPCVLFGLVLVALSVLYSHPRFDHRALPLASSANHFAGGVAQFLMGFAAGAPISNAALSLSVYFGLVFMAGHLIQELRDLEGDAITGVRTNAVQFGGRAAFACSSILFGISYAYLPLLAALGVVPPAWTLISLIGVVHLRAGWRTWSTPLRTSDLLRYQATYRAIFMAIGLLMFLETLARHGVGSL